MTRYDSRRWFLAACLAALAGYVDAIGFLKLGGLFVSFMSGNSTRLAVGLAVEHPQLALKAFDHNLSGVAILPRLVLPFSGFELTLKVYL